MDSLESEMKIALYGGFVMFVALGGMLVYFMSAYRKRQLEHISEKKILEERFNSSIAHSKFEIKEQTLTEISRDLHDNIGQRLTLALMKVRDENGSENDAIEILQSALQDLRQLSRSLNSSYIDELGLDLALEREAQLIHNTGAMACSYTSDDSLPPLQAGKEIILFRCAQELLGNCLRHSAANQIDIELRHMGNWLNLKVRDNGIGISDLDKRGLGLTNIHQRTAILGGSFRIEPRAESGTLASIKIPI